MEHIQDLSFLSFNDPVIVKQLEENNLEKPRSLFCSSFCLKIYFVVEFIQFLWRKQNPVVNLFVLNHSSMRLLLSWFFIQRFRELRF